MAHSLKTKMLISKLFLFYYFLTFSQIWSYRSLVIVDRRGVLMIFILEKHLSASLLVTGSTQAIVNSFWITGKRRSLALPRAVNTLSVIVLWAISSSRLVNNYQFGSVSVVPVPIVYIIWHDKPSPSIAHMNNSRPIGDNTQFYNISKYLYALLRLERSPIQFFCLINNFNLQCLPQSIQWDKTMSHSFISMI